MANDEMAPGNERLVFVLNLSRVKGAYSQSLSHTHTAHTMGLAIKSALHKIANSRVFTLDKMIGVHLPLLFSDSYSS